MKISFIKKIAKMGDRRIITIPSEYYSLLDYNALYLIKMGTVGMLQKGGGVGT
ncbi:MAG: hypothetical protein AB1779_06280 [Candidatus Thermoplasmatota archaeon]